MIGIIGAMDVEVELLVSKLQNKKEKKIANYNFYSGTIENKEVVVIKSGIGKVASSVGAGLMIEEYHPDFIINTGIAGGINGLHTADILIADSLRYSDVDAVNFGYKLGQVPGMPLDYLTDVKIKEKIQQILKDNKIDLLSLQEHAIATLSCKASLKGNSHLSIESMQTIVDNLMRCDNPYVCPHGRPTIIHYSAYELEKLFKRVV